MMWKGRLLVGSSVVFLALGQPPQPAQLAQPAQQTCCGADCQIESNSPAGCTQDRTIAHGGHHVTEAQTMSMDTILDRGYQSMFNASCATEFDNHRINLTVSTVVFDCAGLCPVADYGQTIFDACCADCWSRDTSQLYQSNQDHMTFSHCVGCINTTISAQPEDKADFESRMNATLHRRVGDWTQGIRVQTNHGPHVYGSEHDGDWATNIAGWGGSTPWASAPLPSSPVTDSSRVPLLPLSPEARQMPPRQLQHMFQNSYGYNTRCAAAETQNCSGTFHLKLIDCNDCSGVPILKRACCRDCGCELAQAREASNLENHIHLECSGCSTSCNDHTRSIEPWVQHYVGSCDPLQATITARYFVYGEIPLTFDNPVEVAQNHAAYEGQIAQAVATIVGTDGIDASMIQVTLGEDQTRRLVEDSQRRLSGTIEAAYQISAPSQLAATNARNHIQGETRQSATVAIRDQLSTAGLTPPTTIGSMHSLTGPAVGLTPLSSLPVAAPTRQHTAVQANASPTPTPTSSSGSWLPAILGIAVALGLAVFAVVVFLNSPQASPKKSKNRGLSLSPGPGSKNSPRDLQPAQPTPVVQPTISTILPMANTLQPPLLPGLQMQPAMAVRVPQQPMQYR